VDEFLTRFYTDLIGRLTGPLTLRLFLQPAVAMFLASRDGIKDAREGRPPHLWRLITGDAEVRARRWRETWRAVLMVFTLAVLLDCVYQWMVMRWIYPVEAMFTAVILAIIPYLLLRGTVNRVARTWIQPNAPR
jgi:peptidoglycan/LPS O-acetylase OafA/YrhL